MEALKSICSDTASPALIRMLLKKTKVNSATGCWEWIGYTEKDGYGECRAARHRTGTARVHRNAWIGFYGSVPTGLSVLHRCDNPPCWNPTHLFVGTVADNNRDMAAKGRTANGRKTHCPRDHEYTPENTWHPEDDPNKRVCLRCTRKYGGDPARAWGKTHCINNHEFTEENTYIRPDDGTRQCKECGRIRQRGRSR